MPSFPLLQPPRTCTRCPLHLTRHHLVWGHGNITAPVPLMLIAEGPGKQEDHTGIPFSGKSGRELDLVLARSGIPFSDVYITNTVKCRCPENRDPEPAEIAACSRWLQQEIEQLQPRVIATVGRPATREFLGPVNMEVVHGRAFSALYQGIPCLVVPVYHPAAGLHHPATMHNIRLDFQFLAEVLQGNIEPEPLPGTVPEPPVDYQEVTSTEQLQADLSGNTLIAIDTESIEQSDGTWLPWCLTYSTRPGRARLIRATSTELLRKFNAHTSCNTVTTLLHNSLYDLDVLGQLGIELSTVIDTMVIAYLLQSEPQGLKPLAARHAHMSMRAYTDVVAAATHLNSMQYLAQAISQPWPDPDPVFEWVKGNPRAKQPQNIGKKAARILWDHYNKPETGKGTVDPRARWLTIKLAEGRGMVEESMGRMLMGNLSQIPFQEALHYACRDADATFRVYPVLWHALEQYPGLRDVFWTDMATIPMIFDMQQAGILVNVPHFETLTERFEARMTKLDTEITRRTGQTINPGSHPDVRKLLFDTLKLKSVKRTGTGLASTSEDVLPVLVSAHPVVQVIRDWRSYQKLTTTYSKPMPGFVRSDGKVHPNLRITRTTTGRLSTFEPNLMAIPVRTDDGREMRKGFVASPGCVFVSSDYCLAGDTTIITTRGPLPIYAVRPGDGVLSCKKGKTLLIGCVIAAKLVGPAFVNKLELDDGSSVRCTCEHKWMTYSGRMVETQHLKKGDRLAHVKEGHSGRYPTWYIRSHFNYLKKHIAVAAYSLGSCPVGFEVDHRDGNVEHWYARNLQHLDMPTNRAQGGRRYWRAVKAGKRSDSKRLKALMLALKKRRSYAGASNPNYGNRSGEVRACLTCGKEIYCYPSQPDRKYCSRECYHNRGIRNHKVVDIRSDGFAMVYQLTVESEHNYVLANGLVSGNSQIELRTMAHVSEDPTMIRIFSTDGDIHTQTAMEIFGLSEDRIDKYEHRRPSKTVNFLIPYGGTAIGLHESLIADGADPAVWSVDRCEEFINEWFTLYPGVKRMMDRTRAQARRYGYVTDMFGRMRLTPGVRAADKYIVEKTLREAGNMPIQSGAQGVIKLAMGELNPVYRYYRSLGWHCWPLLQIHDDILSEIHVDLLPTMIALITSIMESVVKLRVPTPIDPEIGLNWGELKGYGSDEAIAIIEEARG